MLDAQVQIRIIELAWKWAETVETRTGPFSGKNTLELFDHAYKALLKTVKSE